MTQNVLGTVQVSAAHWQEVQAFVKQVYWHHASRFKGAPDCTLDYHRQLADKAGELAGMPRIKVRPPKGAR